MIGTALAGVARVTSQVLHRVRYTPNLRPSTDVRVLLYHGIGTNTNPCMSSLRDEIPEALLGAHMRYLAERYTILALDDALSGTRAGPCCCITFDDGLASVYPWLMAHRVPAAVFLNTSVIDNRDLLWQHLISYLVQRFGVPDVFAALARPTGWTEGPESGYALIEYCQRRFGDLARTRALEQTANQFGVDPKRVARAERVYLTSTQIVDLRAIGVQFYSHTARHLPLAALPRDVMEREIDEAAAALNGFASADRFISFPFGMMCDYGQAARAYALARGYAYVLEVGHGANPPDRVRTSRTVARVGLGQQHRTVEQLYAAIEVLPRAKAVLSVVRNH